tara:strand:+ start:7267 stop:7656 length:390 start_codon:yes stop_codon:yes gene_type:complete
MSNYIKFVDKVTSHESKSWESFVGRLVTLHDEGFVPQRTMTAAIGLASEAGEFSEIVKKIIFQGKPFTDETKDHMKKELGDCLWYIAQACMALGLSFDDLFNSNIEKLSSRYPGGFDAFISENKKEDDV